MADDDLNEVSDLKFFHQSRFCLDFPIVDVNDDHQNTMVKDLGSELCKPWKG